MLGMGRRRRDFCVTLGCLEALLRERRIVVQVNQIVSDAGVIAI